MATYLGMFDIDLTAEEFEDLPHGADEWALAFIERYGGIDGDHHKQWTLDQVARVLMNTPVIVKEARWADGEKEIRFWTGEPSAMYLEWLEGDPTDTDIVGIAP